MKTSIIFRATLFLCAAAFAEPMKMPSKSEIKEVKSSVAALVSSGVTADEILKMANETKSAAERYQLYGHAFILRCKDGKGNEAAAILREFREAFEDIPATTIASLIEKNAKKLLSVSPVLEAEYKRAKECVLVDDQIAHLTTALKKLPNDEALNRKLGEAYAAKGDWKAAISRLEKGGADLREIIRAEKVSPSMKTAGFWWEYKPSFPPATNSFKLYAGTIYQVLLETETLSVIEKVIAEKRIAQLLELDASSESVDAKGKVITNSQNLVHRWSFNGNLKDSVGDADARIIGNGAINDKACNVNLGGIDLCDVAHEFKPDTPFTIEAWYTRNGDTFGSRMILLSRPDKHEVGMTSGGRNEHWFHLNGYAKSWEESEVHINCGVPTYMAICYDPSSSNASWRIYIASNNGEVAEKIFEDAQKIGPICYFALGAPCTYPSMSRFSYANAVYDECRIWKKALTKEEVKKSYKAGPDRIVNK